MSFPISSQYIREPKKLSLHVSASVCSPPSAVNVSCSIARVSLGHWSPVRVSPFGRDLNQNTRLRLEVVSFS